MHHKGSARHTRWVGGGYHVFNYDRPHMSLDLDNLETPARAFVRKMPPPGQVVIDKQTGEEYDVR